PRVMKEAYTHEVSSCGYWPGPLGEEGVFYAYAYPEPDGVRTAPGTPGAAPVGTPTWRTSPCLTRWSASLRTRTPSSCPSCRAATRRPRTPPARTGRRSNDREPPSTVGKRR